MFHIPNSFTKVSSSLKDFQFELIYVLKKKTKKQKLQEDVQNLPLFYILI